MTELLTQGLSAPEADCAATVPSVFDSKFGEQQNVRWRQQALLIAGALMALLIWDASGLDFWISSQIATLNHSLVPGFSMRHAWFTEELLHRGGKFFYGVVFVWLAYNYFRPLTTAVRIGRRRQRWWFMTIVLCIAAISLLKYLSKSSCPWDLAAFGGTATQLSHWNFVLADGGPGKCFPSGHVSGAFALLGVSYAIRPISAKIANWALVAVLALGTILGAGQVLRGAHFVSHVLYSAWLCWLICFVSDRVYAGNARREAFAKRTVANE